MKAAQLLKDQKAKVATLEQQQRALVRQEADAEIALREVRDRLSFTSGQLFEARHTLNSLTPAKK